MSYRDLFKTFPVQPSAGTTGTAIMRQPCAGPCKGEIVTLKTTAGLRPVIVTNVLNDTVIDGIIVGGGESPFGGRRRRSGAVAFSPVFHEEI